MIPLPQFCPFGSVFDVLGLGAAVPGVESTA